MHLQVSSPDIPNDDQRHYHWTVEQEVVRANESGVRRVAYRVEWHPTADPAVDEGAEARLTFRVDGAVETYDATITAASADAVVARTDPITVN